jgi:hypothetical protein
MPQLDAGLLGLRAAAHGRGISPHEAFEVGMQNCGLAFGAPPSWDARLRRTCPRLLSARESTLRVRSSPSAGATGRCRGNGDPDQIVRLTRGEPRSPATRLGRGARGEATEAYVGTSQAAEAKQQWSGAWLCRAASQSVESILASEGKAFQVDPTGIRICS